jgi:hypothetical protein
MRSLIASGCVAIMLLSAAPSYAQLDVGSGLVGAGVGAAIGGIAGGGRGAATGAIVGGSVGAVTGAYSPHPSYAYPYRGYVAQGGCRWVPAALRPLGRMAAGPLRTVLEGRFKRSAVGCNSCNCLKSATIVTTV